jgi:transcriptional regulator with XRE-family HTH domain
MGKFADRVRELRKKAKLSQHQLAKLAGLSQTTISDIERGRNEGSREVVALARALKVDAESLTNGRAEPQQDTRQQPLPVFTPDQRMIATVWPYLPPEKKTELLNQMAGDPERYKALLDALLTEVSYSTVKVGGGAVMWDGSERRKKERGHG